MAGITHTEVPLPSFDKPVKVLLVVSPYYAEIAANMVAGAEATLTAAGASFDRIDVPGALEIPTAISIANNHSNFDGFVALGCVVRGETTHYETVCNDSSRALQLLGLEGVCIGNGILTVENIGQAEVRADPADQNKGGGAAAAALHLVALSRKWGGPAGDIGFKGKSILMAGEESKQA